MTTLITEGVGNGDRRSIFLLSWIMFIASLVLTRSTSWMYFFKWKMCNTSNTHPYIFKANSGLLLLERMRTIKHTLSLISRFFASFYRLASKDYKYSLKLLCRFCNTAWVLTIYWKNLYYENYHNKVMILNYTETIINYYYWNKLKR